MKFHLLNSVKVLFIGLTLLVSVETNAQGYVVDWNDSSTYTVTCGSMAGSKWSVHNNGCNYFSPKINSGGGSGDPDKRAVFNISVNPTGNMESDDYLVVKAYNEDSLQASVTVAGDTVNSTFTVSFEFMVPATSDVTVVIDAINNQHSEKWIIENGGIAVSFPASPLPVELEGFEGHLKGSTAVLQWITRAELNNDYFTIERSADGRNYKPVGYISGKGTTTTTSYYFFTEDLDDGTLAYYRLKQTDFNGEFKYMGKVVALRAGRKSAVSVFPNPVADDSFHILVSDFKNEELAVELRDVNGKVVFSRLVFPGSQSEDLTLSRQDLNIEAGLYLVSVKSSSSVYSERLFVQD